VPPLARINNLTVTGGEPEYLEEPFAATRQGKARREMTIGESTSRSVNEAALLLRSRGLREIGRILQVNVNGGAIAGHPLGANREPSDGDADHAPASTKLDARDADVCGEGGGHSPM